MAASSYKHMSPLPARFPANKFRMALRSGAVASGMEGEARVPLPSSVDLRPRKAMIRRSTDARAMDYSVCGGAEGKKRRGEEK